jgi:hypothetical protein
MKTTHCIRIFVMALSVCFAGLAFAQSGSDQPSSPKAETAAQGIVEKVTNVTDGQGWYGVHLTLKSANRTYDVRLGPSDFIAQSNFAFVPGDLVHVWGTQIGANGSLTIVARAIEKNGQTLTLRDANGFLPGPVWGCARAMADTAMEVAATAVTGIMDAVADVVITNNCPLSHLAEAPARHFTWNRRS